MILHDLRKDNMKALKEHDLAKKAILAVVIAKCVEAATSGAEKKELSDSEVLKIIQKVYKELEEERKTYEDAGRQERADEISKQQSVLEGYLPRQLSEEEIRGIIKTLSDQSMPAIMKHFKENYAGKCDMGLVNKIAREG